MNGILDIVIFCKDTNASKTWYEDVGFEFLRGHDGMYWFKIGEGELMLHPDDTKSKSGDGVYQFVVKDLLSLSTQLNEKGFSLIDFSTGATLTDPIVRPWGYKEFGLRDPDNYTWAFIEKPKY
jgi:catechol 2,3-dioxygenase-like lactoylglutathione lyase family enzyme